MNTKYFRITVYHPAEDLSAIFDSYGMYEQIGQFAAHFTEWGLEVISATTAEHFLDGNLDKSAPILDKMILRACAKGRPEHVNYGVGGALYPAIKVGDGIYIPNGASAVKPAADNGASGLYKQYMQVKAENPGAIVFYRVGDFYEVLAGDASTASAMLGLTLTSRDMGLDERIPMCGVAHHSIDAYIKKLTDFGFKVAIAEPSEN